MPIVEGGRINNRFRHCCYFCYFPGFFPESLTVATRGSGQGAGTWYEFLSSLRLAKITCFISPFRRMLDRELICSRCKYTRCSGAAGMMSWQRINDIPPTTVTNHNHHHHLDQPIVNQPSMSPLNNRPRSRPDDIFTAEEIDNCFHRLTPTFPLASFLWH